MRCCPNCFQHKWLKEKIRELSKETDQCECCGSEEAPVLEASELSGYFDNLLSMYVEAESFESGESLIRLIQWHWQVFDEDVLGEDAQTALLEEIANSDWDDDDGEAPLNAHDLYQPLGTQYRYTHRDRWEEFCSEVRDNPEKLPRWIRSLSTALTSFEAFFRHIKKFVLRHAATLRAPLPFEDYFAEDFAQLSVTLPAGTRLFRARPGFSPGECGERRPYRDTDIGAPPTEKAHAGRASVGEQRVLYCADQEATAVAEVRPARGSYVSIAPMTLRREVRILDLAQDAPEINPFVTETLRWDVEIQSLLEAFAEEMSRPLERRDDPTHYAPCQRLADYIRYAGFDGIRYPGALAPEGTNVTFFDPAIADVGESKLVKITDASLKYEHEEVDPVVPRIGAKGQPRAEVGGQTETN